MFLLIYDVSADATLYTPEPPHSDYRPGYAGGCGGGAACHDITKNTFLSESLNHNATDAASQDYTNFCISCHNAAGEAHEKSAGSPSTNSYVNLTGLDLSLPYSGDSHSWNGKNGNASTRTPRAAGFRGTTTMPGGNVRCQTCHSAMNKSSVEQNVDWESTNNAGGYVRYRFVHYTSTAKYLSQYIKVYRSTGFMTRPLNSRTKKQYLVDPSEYAYSSRSALITFKAPQSQFSYIYADIPEPYFRVGNPGNAICVDCHNSGNSQSVSHSPGSGVKSNHPVGINYGYSFGRHNTLKPQAAGNAYVENGQMFCTSCHDPHNAASDNGQILRETDGATLCGDCHKTRLAGYSTAGSVNIHTGNKHSENNEPATVCLDCHTTHGSNNIMLIKNVINGKAVSFQNFTGARSFGPDTGYGICEVCHTYTGFHLSDNSSSAQGHNPDRDCTRCHPHSRGFAPSGLCDTCYNNVSAIFAINHLNRRVSNAYWPEYTNCTFNNSTAVVPLPSVATDNQAGNWKVYRSFTGIFHNTTHTGTVRTPHLLHVAGEWLRVGFFGGYSTTGHQGTTVHSAYAGFWNATTLGFWNNTSVGKRNYSTMPITQNTHLTFGGDTSINVPDKQVRYSDWIPLVSHKNDTLVVTGYYTNLVGGKNYENEAQYEAGNVASVTRRLAVTGGYDGGCDAWNALSVEVMTDGPPARNSILLMGESNMIGVSATRGTGNSFAARMGEIYDLYNAGHGGTRTVLQAAIIDQRIRPGYMPNIAMCCWGLNDSGYYTSPGTVQPPLVTELNILNINTVFKSLGMKTVLLSPYPYPSSGTADELAFEQTIADWEKNLVLDGQADAYIDIASALRVGSSDPRYSNSAYTIPDGHQNDLGGLVMFQATQDPTYLLSSYNFSM